MKQDDLTSLAYNATAQITVYFGCEDNSTTCETSNDIGSNTVSFWAVVGLAIAIIFTLAVVLGIGYFFLKSSLKKKEEDVEYL
jgi:capsular polysaccharide biosynthesis protein